MVYNRTVWYDTKMRWVDMEKTQNSRAQKTREQIRVAAKKLFLEHGYLATSTDAILAEAGIASKETLYRHYASKEELFVDVLGNLTLEQPRPSSVIAQIPAINDLQALKSVADSVSWTGALVLFSEVELNLRVLTYDEHSMTLAGTIR